MDWRLFYFTTFDKRQSQVVDYLLGVKDLHHFHNYKSLPNGKAEKQIQIKHGLKDHNGILHNPGFSFMWRP